MSRYLKRLSKFLFITLFTFYCLIWLFSPSIVRYVANNHGLPKQLLLTSDSNIRYNPFTAHLTISDLEMKTNEQESVLRLQDLEAELHLHQLLFDTIYVSEFSINGVFIPVSVNESSLNVAGFEIGDDKPASEAVEVETDEPSGSFLYEIIIPEFNLTDANIELTHLEKKHNIQLDSFSLEDILLSKDQQDIQLNLLSQFNSAPISVVMNAQLLQRQGQVSIDLDIKNIALSSAQAFLPTTMTGLAGTLGYSSKINIDITNEQTSANISDLLLSVDNFHLEQSDIIIGVTSQKIQAEDLAILLSANEPVSIKTTLNYLIEDISVKPHAGNAILGDISNISVNNIAVAFEQNVPKINIEKLQISKSQFSKDLQAELPALTTFKQLSLNDIEYTPELIEINDIGLSGLMVNVLLDENKKLATLVEFVNDTQHESDDIAEKSLEQEVAQESDSNTITPIFRLGKFALLDTAHIDFNDSSVTPNYERNVSISHLSLAAIDSSEPQQEALFDMLGKSDKYANFDIKGRGLPFATQREFKLDAVVKELSLPGVSSYIKDALQYEIESGQLDITITAGLKGSEIDGDVDLLLRGVEFTAADDHETGTLTDQTSVPFNVALGMLKDSDGNVELSVPLTGDTSAPSFGFSGFLTLLIKQATMSAAKDYLITTFVPYASVLKVALAAGEFALKLRINDLNYLPEQVELNAEQIEFSRQMSVMLEDQSDVNVKLCAIATASDIGLDDVIKAQTTDNVTRLKAISQQRVDIFKAYMVEQLQVPSAKLLLCTPQIDSSTEAKSRIEFVI